MLQVAVTGAGGFIGGRLTEVLAHQPGMRVHALLRRGSNPARVARYGNVRLFFGDVCTSDFVGAALDGCSQVLHCAYGTQGSAEEQRRVTVEGTLNVYRAARERGVGRMVHLSSVAVWGYEAVGTIDESTPAGPEQSGYCADKKEAEDRLADLAARDSSVAVSMLLPTLVYGPYSAFVLDVVRRMRAGTFGLPPAAGVVNHVYVDDLVHGILLAARSQAPGVQRYILTDPEPLPCAQFFAPLASAVGAAPLSVARRAAGIRKASPSVGEVVQSILQNRELRQWLRQVPGLQKTYRAARGVMERPRLPDQQAAAAEPAAAQPVVTEPTLSAGEWDFYSSPATFAGTKAARKLGFAPVVGYGEGMRRTVLWLEHLGLL